jgi:hypothetical protein
MLRDILFAVSLGIAPFAAGCVGHDPLPSDLAHAPAVYVGRPLLLRVGFSGIKLPRDLRGDARAALFASVAERSFLNVLRATKAFDEVRDLTSPTTTAAARANLDLVLSGELSDFDIRSSYAWWALYGALFLIPLAWAPVIIGVLLLGGPVASDSATLRYRIHALDARTGRVVGRYDGVYDGYQTHTIWGRGRVEESFVAHPEIVFQGAATTAIQAMVRDRFWLLRFRG